MARSQTWTRNISKKIRKEAEAASSRPIVNNEALESIKRRAEKLGLILHGQSPRHVGQKRGKK